MSYNFSMRDLLEAGVHYGHRKNFWNPKMSTYIYGVRNGIHIVDLGKTAPLLENALKALKESATKGAKVLFVGTKKQAAEVVAQEAERCGQYYVNHRWLGGMMTNWPTVSESIKTLQRYEEILANEDSALNKKERLDLDRKRIKLNNVLGGIRNMGGKPDLIFVIDTNLEKLAIAEAQRLGIPIIAIVDTNSNPDGIDYIIPGNDDARKAIELYTRLASDAILAGMQESLAGSGIDLGAIDLGASETGDFDISGLAMEGRDEATKTKAAGKKKTTTVVTKKAPKKKVEEATAPAAE